MLETSGYAVKTQPPYEPCKRGENLLYIREGINHERDIRQVATVDDRDLNVRIICILLIIARTPYCCAISNTTVDGTANGDSKATTLSTLMSRS